MSLKDKFTFTADFGDMKVTNSIEQEALVLDEMLLFLSAALRAAGYVFDGELQIVDKPNPKKEKYGE